jgi:hypothetical protein
MCPAEHPNANSKWSRTQTGTSGSRQIGQEKSADWLRRNSQFVPVRPPFPDVGSVAAKDYATSAEIVSMS